MKLEELLTIKNSQTIAFNKVPVVDFFIFRKTVIENIQQGFRVNSFFGVPNRHFLKESKELRLIIVFSKLDIIYLLSTTVEKSFKSLTPECPQVRLFEREIYEQYGIEPLGHPFLKPVRFQKPFSDFKANEGRKEHEIGSTKFFKLSGHETHEVAVGPVHAGVIEPGHFRFQCHGETVYNLEISLGYQHRGIEQALINGPDKRTKYILETVAGDTTIGHTTAYSQIIEALTDTKLSERAQAIRAIAAELERIANHIGDLGALSGDVGYLPTNSFCGRIRGNFLNLTAEICGNRFGRGLVKPGGVNYDIDSKLSENITTKIKKLIVEAEGAISLLWKSNSVVARFEGTGIVTDKMMKDLGFVGYVARSCDVKQDVRSDFPYGIYKSKPIPIASYKGGDVFARAYIRWLEIVNSGKYVLELLQNLPDGQLHNTPNPISANQIAISLAEGWRGELCHVAITGSEGKFIRYKIVDPSFHNWIALALVLRQEGISDFPLCNKSFNLSYCGHDL